MDTIGRGGGTPSDPYLIQSGLDYKKLIDDVAAGTNYAGQYFTQTVNLDFSGVKGVAPIGGNAPNWSDSDAKEFSGNYDGGGNTLRNLDIICPATDDVGVFGAVSNSLIENLGRVGGQTVARDCAGGIIGRMADNSTIRNCYNTSKVSITWPATTAGGLVAFTYRSGTQRIENCYNFGEIISVAPGGILSVAHGQEGDPTTTSVYITGCYNAGKIGDGREGAAGGGICGILKYCQLTIQNCYNVGRLNNINYATGAIFGHIIRQDLPIISNCYYLDESAPDGVTGIGNVSATEDVPDSKTTAWPLTRSQMQGAETVDGETFLALLNTGLDVSLQFHAAPAGSKYPFPWVPNQADIPSYQGN